jgi:hypothetical protein
MTLAKIQAGGNVNDPLVVAEWEEITTVLAAERLAGKGWRKFFHNGMWRRTAAGFSVQAWQQLSGGRPQPVAKSQLLLHKLTLPPQQMS